VKDVKRILPSEKQNIQRIYNGPNYDYHPMGDPESSSRLTGLGIDPCQPFLLHVGGNQWYKNRLGVLKIFAELVKNQRYSNLLLVMAGKPWTDEMRSLAGSLGIQASCREISGVSNEDLRALYSRAEALLFPSLEEGFGWPIIEAHACGCPVVTSNRAPMTEVGGTAARYVDPQDEKQAANILSSVIDSRASLHQENLQNAARFSTAKMIAEYLKFYARILAAQSPTLANHKA
jgi:glycosyltransferase involved in cell wall biosynthesis